VVIRGVLVGLIESSTSVYKDRYSGNVLISVLPKKNYIENSPSIIEIVKNLPWTFTYSARYVQSGSIEGTYKERIDYQEKANEAGANLAGIDPEREDRTTGLSSKIIEGSYLTVDDTDSILVGANLLKKYLAFESPAFTNLDKVETGSKVRVTVGDITREMKVKGVVKSKVDELNFA